MKMKFLIATIGIMLTTYAYIHAVRPELSIEIPEYNPDTSMNRDSTQIRPSKKNIFDSPTTSILSMDEYADIYSNKAIAPETLPATPETTFEYPEDTISMPTLERPPIPGVYLNNPFSYLTQVTSEEANANITTAQELLTYIYNEIATMNLNDASTI